MVKKLYADSLVRYTSLGNLIGAEIIGLYALGFKTENKNLKEENCSWATTKFFELVFLAIFSACKNSNFQKTLKKGQYFPKSMQPVAGLTTQ